MKDIDRLILEKIRSNQPITFEQLLEQTDLYAYDPRLRPAIMANTLNKLLVFQEIQLTASTGLPLSFTIRIRSEYRSDRPSYTRRG
jgi:hypothetical protein